MARSVYRHSSARLWAARHRWLVRLAVVLVLAAGAAIGYSVSAPAPARHPSPAAEPPAATGPFAVLSTTPVAGGVVDSDSPVTVQLSQPLAASSPLPGLQPPVDGTWTRRGARTLVFDAAAPLPPGAKETLTVPGGTAGLRDSGGRTLAQPVMVSFTTRSSTLRLQQLLAQLGYLPVTFTPSGGVPAPKEMAQPQPGAFAWRWTDRLQGLEDHWAAGESGVITQGAVMTFQDQHHLTVDGIAGPELWTALLHAAAEGQRNTQSYDYVYVDKDLPEHLVLYVDGVAKFPNVAVNTGLHGADTPDGTYAVFEHVPASEMKGTNPDGSTYDDPNVPWASYFYQGDALHGFVRATYGTPQSNGCVEMSISDAGTLWPYTPIGTLVTVVGPPT
jgi:peptidoglycan hydrolase-like protein with peptidoglycan-binding domain